QLVISGCPADFPPVHSLDRTTTRLPAQATTVVGREGEIAEGQRLLERGRLVTLTGPGGTGKTRLSIRIAEESAHEFGDGTFFVPLAPISDPELVPSTIAHTLGVQISGAETPLARVLEHVRDKKMLLVLDNFEQILPAATVVRDVLGASGALKVIASSRAPLRISGEQEFPVPPLELPDPEHLPALRGAVQWSGNLLAPAEPRQLAHLGRFAGGEMLAQVEPVCCHGAALGADGLDVPTAHVDDSVVRQSDVAGEPHFRIHLPIRV